MEDFWKLRKGIIHDDLGFQYSADWYANKYHRNPLEEQMTDPGPGQYKERDMELINIMGIKNGDSILIPGCGKANNVSLLKSMYKELRITGIDWSETAIRFCRHVFPEFVFMQYGIADLTLPNESFDHVLAIDFTEHLSLADYVAFLAKCCHILRSGGMLGILPGLSVRPEHINLIYPPTIAQHVEQHGFEIIAIGPQWFVGRKPRNL